MIKKSLRLLFQGMDPPGRMQATCVSVAPHGPNRVMQGQRKQNQAQEKSSNKAMANTSALALGTKAGASDAVRKTRTQLGLVVSLDYRARFPNGGFTTLLRLHGEQHFGNSNRNQQQQVHQTSCSGTPWLKTGIQVAQNDHRANVHHGNKFRAILSRLAHSMGD